MVEFRRLNWFLPFYPFSSIFVFGYFMQMGLEQAHLFHLSCKTHTRRIMKLPTRKSPMRGNIYIETVIHISTVTENTSQVLSSLSFSPSSPFLSLLSMDNGAAMFNGNDRVAIAREKAARAHNQYGYALRAYKNSLQAAGAAGYDADDVDVAKDAWVAASQALNRANDELAKLMRIRRRSHVRLVMRQLSKLYRRIARLSKRHGPNFKYPCGIAGTKARLFVELKDEFGALNWTFSAIDPGNLPTKFADHEERYQLFLDRSIYWSTLASDRTKPWASA